MKKRLVTTTALISVAALITGCGASAKNQTASTTQAADSGGQTVESEKEENTKQDTKEAKGNITLTVLDGYAPEDPHGQYVYQYAEEFMKENPEIKVEIQAIATNDIYTKLAAMATTPKELPSIFFTSVDSVPTLYDLGITADLNELMPQEDIDALANGVYEATLIDGHMSFYPVVVQPQAVIYRKDRFEELGLTIPKTWDEFVDNAEKLTRDTNGDGKIDEWGFSMVGSNNSSGQSRFMSYLWSNGIDCVQKDGSQWVSDINTEEKFMTAFSRWTKMNADGVVPTGITEVDYATSANYFAMGYTSMFLTGSNALGVAYANNPELVGKLGSFKMPGEMPGTMLNGEGYAISEYASEEEKAAAVKYLEFFANHDAERKFWESSGKIPATKEGQKVEYITGEDYAGFLQTIADGCKPTLTFAGISGLKSALGNAYSAVFSGEKTDAEAVESLMDEVDELLEDYN